MHIDVSMIINCHREKQLALASLSCFQFLREEAEGIGLKVEWVVVIDKGDQETKSLISSSPFLKASDQLHEIDIGDTGLSRNFGALRALGQYVCFFDVDDLYSRNWLVAAYHFALKSPENYLFHPEYTVCFDQGSGWIKMKDQVSYGKDILTLMKHNLWPYSVFLLRKQMADLPYQSAKIEEGFGYEDWHWNCETVGKGCIHKIVPQTVQFYRLKAAHLSRCRIQEKYQAAIKPSCLFKIIEK